jgi:hypothetical protein
VLRNTGSDRLANVAISCTFTGSRGTVLDTQIAPLAEIAGRSEITIETIYYGWPRADGVACHRLVDSCHPAP